MKKERFTLLQYSIFAATAIIGNKANGQVNYTNLDPDIYLDDLYETCTLDINNDGIQDFLFLNWLRQFSTFTDSGSPGASFDEFVQFAGGYFNVLNEIAGTLSVKYEYYGVEYLKYFPYALDSNELIDNHLEFQNWFYQSMAFKSYRNNGTNIFDSGGDWFPNESEKFLGVRFVDADDQLYYGWIRCSVIDSAEGLIIHDYAYETQPNQPIEAGSTISYVGLHELSALTNNFQIYSFNKTVYINCNEVTAALNFQILNIHGEVIAFGEINNIKTKIPLLVPSGIYIIDIKNNAATLFSKKVVVN